MNSLMIAIEVLRLIEYCFYILNCVIKCSSNLAIFSGCDPAVSTISKLC